MASTVTGSTRRATGAASGPTSTLGTPVLATTGVPKVMASTGGSP